MLRFIRKIKKVTISLIFEEKECCFNCLFVCVKRSDFLFGSVLNRKIGSGNKGRR